ncbi:MAG: hypothetical protein E6K41_03885 [Gammaproteobacteria bacterium]|nr:MAG: hypothetical protein E6K41_03885 [Gammaproteobacteria bacterium]TLY83409.1 MAG: hypothetical protein E6K42_02445 [Gammaproteobacteria bacterium]TLZ32499.1 MAG: hypothetical protein E6K29_01365 [Gammaproteobacteria bacterium]TLZ50572.1 MAG: hypothetical protein E6K22_13125 [Gammaproteobacteria bacterium]TLZ63670.1 MAG: hypothetical protein E6K20_01800 [Gammaproteobacteria bacterium]
MKQLIQLFAQIALLRRGPQDLPASTLLLALTVGGYLCVNLVVSGLMPPVQGWPEPAQVPVDTVFTLVWYVALLKLFGRSERILQTATAVFGFQVVLSPLLTASAWLVLRFRQDALWQVPVVSASLLLLIWLIAAYSQIVKAALEWSSPASVVLAILQVLTGQMLLVALFPSAKA